jgi:CHAD domain-containing protein
MAHGPGKVEIDPAGSFREAAHRSLAVRGPELVVHREGTLAGDDIEALHQMRVASRRLRAVLEVYAGCFPPRRHRRLLGLVKDTADALSEARDLDVQIEGLLAHAAAAPADDRAGIESLVASLRERRAAADEHLPPALARLDDERFLRQVQRLVGEER